MDWIVSLSPGSALESRAAVPASPSPTLERPHPRRPASAGLPRAPLLSIRRERKHVTARRILSRRHRLFTLLRLRERLLGCRMCSLWLSGVAAGCGVHSAFCYQVLTEFVTCSSVLPSTEKERARAGLDRSDPG